MDISVTVCVRLCLFICTVTDFSTEDKAGGVKFCTAVHWRPRQGISHFGGFDILDIFYLLTKFGDLITVIMVI